MRKTLILLGVAALIACTCTVTLAASRGVTFKPIGFIDDPGPLPASMIIDMDADGDTLLTSPTPYGTYITLTTFPGLDWTLVGNIYGAADISDDGQTVMATAYDAGPGGLDWASIWNGTVDDWTAIPAPDGFSPCGGSALSMHGMAGSGEYATGLTWQGCSYARGFKWDSATNTTLDLGSMNGDSSRGNAVSNDGNVIGGWTRMLCGTWRGAKHVDGQWSWVDPNGNNEPKACVQSGGGCCSNYDCPEFVDDGACSNHGACDQSGIDCDKTGITCDKTDIYCDNAGITCDKTDIACVDNICTGGPNAGNECNYSSDCPGTCTGGPNAGLNCNYSSHCPGLCVGGPSEGNTCTSDYYCPGTCTAGPNAGVSCTSNSGCPGTCTAGAAEGQACNYLSQCPGQCNSGPNAGQQCSYDSSCPGTCTGGSAEGESCTGDYYCPDTEVCSMNPNFTYEAFKGEVSDVSADGQYMVGYNYGQSSYDYSDPLYDPTLWASAWRSSPDGTFTKVGIPPYGNPSDSWTPFQISDDGGTIVGRYGWWIYSYPVLWTEETGTLDLQYFLIEQGFDEMWYWYLTDLTSVNADGTIVAGHGYNPENWLEGYVIDISKVKVCHTPPGNPAGRRTVSIAWESIPDHLAHGDQLATCEFLTSGARSRSMSEFRPQRPANLEVPEEAVNTKWHSKEDLAAQRALVAGTGSEASATPASDTRIEESSTGNTNTLVTPDTPERPRKQLRTKRTTR